MTKQQFLEAFKSALSGENASPDFVNEQTALLEEKLVTLSDEDFEKRADRDNVSILVRSAMEEYLSRTRHTDTSLKPAEPEVSSEDAAPDKDSDVSEQESDSNEETKIVTDDSAFTVDDSIASEETKKIDSTPISDEEDKIEQLSSDDDDVVTVDMTPVVTSVKKKDDNAKQSFFATLMQKAENKSATVIFTVLTVLSIPLVLFAAFAALGGLVAVYFALAAIIVAIIGAILLVVFGGGLVSIVALLYGATQIMQPPRYVGIHEIGFAFIVIGATILISVILYNIAVRLIPWVLSKASAIFKWLVSAVKRLAEKAKKGCEKL